MAIESGRKRVKVKLVVSKTQPTRMPCEKVQHLVGRDFGYNNTCTFSVVRVARPLTEEKIQTCTQFKKEEAKQYLETHHQPGSNVVVRRRFEGKKFLSLMSQHSQYIARLSSQIDGKYNKFFRRKSLLCARLGVDEATELNKVCENAHVLVQRIHQKFFVLWEELQMLKQKRRSLYSRMKALRRC